MSRWRVPPAPPWWPPGEPWPPPRRRPAGRPRTVQYRLAGLLGVALPLMFVGAIVLMRGIGGGGDGPYRVWPWPLAIPAIVFVFVMAMRRIGRPMDEVMTAAERVAAGDFTARATPHGPPWLRALAISFNRMTSTLERQQRQRRDLMADIAHELRTPLSVMQGRLEGMLDGIYPRDERQVAQVLEDTRLLARLVEDLRTLAHSEAGTLRLEREPTDLAALADDVLASLGADAGARRITITTALAPDLPPLDLDPLRMREVIANLLTNAIRHAPPGSAVRIAAARAGTTVTIHVHDNGPGIPPEDLPHIFDRFAKGAASSGSGLGLTISRNLVAAHGGTLTADSRPDRGTTFTVTLPAPPADR